MLIPAFQTSLCSQSVRFGANTPQIQTARNRTHLNQIISSANKPVIVVFTRDYCEAAYKQTQVIQQIQQRGASVQVVEANVDSDPSLRAYAADHDIHSVPTFLLFKNGNKVDRQVGMGCLQYLLNKV